MDLNFVDYISQNKFEIDRIVDETFFRLMEPTAPIDRFMPVVNYDVSEMLLLKLVRSNPTVASIVAEEQEIPRQRNRVSLREEQLTDLKIGKQYIFTAQDYKMMERMRGYLARANAQNLVRSMEQYFFGIAADIPVSIVEKLTVLMFQIVTTGQCIFTDPLSGARVEFTYPGTSDVLLPPPLTGTARWNQPTTANALQNLLDHGEAFYDRFGYYPRAIVMRENIFKQIRNQTSTKRAWQQRTGNPTDAATDFSGTWLSDEVVMDLISERLRGAEVIKFDAMYSETQADGTILDKNYLAADTYFFAEEGNMERAFIPTVEKDFQPGFYVAARVLNDMPRQERLGGVGNGIPAVFDARKLAARTVVSAA